MTAQDQQSRELLPCPFCGSPAEFAHRGGKISHVRCTHWGAGCFGSGTIECTEVNAAAAWNRRAPPAGMESAKQTSDTLTQIAAVAACFGADWPDVEGEPEVLRRVKWAARQLNAAQEYPLLTDERISEIDDETHFHESPDWPRRFARAIEAEARKKPAP